MKKVTVRELGKVVTGHTPPTAKREYYGNSYLFLKPTDMVIGQKYTYVTEEGYSALGAEKYKTSLIPKGATCVVCIGTLGEKMSMAHCDLFTNQSVNSIIPIDNYDQHYVYYLIKHNLHKLKALNKGTASGREFVSKTTFLDIEIDVIEDIKTQKKIGEILSAYDDLIENNQKQIKLLEEAAQRLYKEWFVDLRFPGYEETPIVDGVPKGWAFRPISELISYEIGGGWGEESPTGKNTKEAYVIRGTDLYGITHGDLLSIPFRFHTESNLSSRNLTDGDIVFEVSGGSRTEGVARCLLVSSAMLDAWRNNVMCASFCKLIRPQTGYSYYLHDCFKYMRATGKTEEYDKRSASSIVNYRWKDFLSQELLLVPPSEIIEQYSNYSRTIYFKLVDCSLQISSAKEARDRLLPKLMSGEIEP